ncbi:predicted protein [Arabidopsis lyrata subsp. lyrata]|uniref:Predicted protein n=1 Tax=Arabidopsis lyrata subsp. lyrata TaxID=81972 RepID=D7LI54_ARALL|nr:predicted protein [Arabidopsis lyrata subsp. lyrata]
MSSQRLASSLLFNLLLPCESLQPSSLLFNLLLPCESLQPSSLLFNLLLLSFIIALYRCLFIYQVLSLAADDIYVSDGDDARRE